MEFTKEKPECKFALPDNPTVRQQLTYFSLSATADNEKFLEQSWQGAKAVILPASWKCKVIPDLDVDLDTLTDPQATEVILWVGMEVRKFMNELERLPKN